MLPLYKWSGGKRKEINNFKSFYPANFKCYIEPFFGAGATFFELNFSNNVISDVHPESINFLREIKLGNALKIIELMKLFPNEEKVYYFIRDEYRPLNKTEEAFRFYYLRKTCFRGMLRYNQKGKFNIPFGKYKSINFDDLLNNNYEIILKNTIIYNEDFRKIFELYNDENNFVFLDPPYDSEFTDYGYCSFGKVDHVDLANVFKETKNKCLLIIAKTDFIENLYEKFIISSYSKNYAFKIYGGRVGDEINKEHLIIKNY